MPDPPQPTIQSPARFLTSRFRIPFVVGSIFFATAFVTRLGLLVATHLAPADGWPALVRSVGIGELFDFLASLWLVAPLVVVVTLVPERWWAHRRLRWLAPATVALALFAALFVAAAEGFFFAEFNGRFNFVAVDYLLYPTEVVTNIRESYPVGLVVGAVSITALLGAFALRRALQPAFARPSVWRERLAALGLFAISVTGTTWFVSPELARVSEDRVLNEIATNGYYSFWMALVGVDAPYDGLYASDHSAAASDRLQRLLVEPAAVSGSFVAGTSRRMVRPAGSERRLNVVVVLEESLGSEFVGVLHPRPDSLTPSYDTLAAQGTLFTHAYSTGNRTIRAIEATTSSLPPLPGISVVRRAGSVNLFTLPALLRDRGYETLFVYGGRALFDGMGSYVRANGIDRVVDQADFPSGTFSTAWGVSDEAIFTRAIEEFDQLHAAGKPFYSLVLSVSNHRPFTFPATGIQPIPGLERRENAVRYADYALGRFIEQARSHDFFRDTIFVLMGDHGARVYGANEIPLASYEVPILFLAPGIVPAGRIDTLASAMDVPPTILGLLGTGYESKFLGHDLLAVSPDAGRAPMTHNNEVALLRGARIAVLGLHQSVRVFDLGAGGRFVLVDPLDREARELASDAIALFSSADQLYRSGAYKMEPGGTTRFAAARPQSGPATLHLLRRPG